ncbi:hypothetical protein OG900_09405 [Streptomyces sp. NBC_00433]
MSRPTADRLADEAGRCLAERKAEGAWQGLHDRALTYLTRLSTQQLGAPVIACLDLARDDGPLLEQAARALAIRAAGNLDAVAHMMLAYPTHGPDARVDRLVAGQRLLPVFRHVEVGDAQEWPDHDFVLGRTSRSRLAALPSAPAASAA